MSAPAGPKPSKTSRIEADFNLLLQRVRLRNYPETLPTLCLYWLKTAYMAGYDRSDWAELDRLLEAVVGSQGVDSHSGRALAGLRDLLREQDLLSGEAPPRPPRTWLTRGTATVTDDAIGPYIVRLLNDWIPKELARVLLEETGDNTAVPARTAPAVAAAIERILIRQPLAPEVLERVLDPGLVSPRLVYPGDYEVLRDVVLFLLGRMEAPAVDALPAVLLWRSAETRFPQAYADAFANAEITEGASGAILQVPISAFDVQQLLAADPFHLTSVAVTMDGRWWHSYALATGERNGVLYRSMGYLHIDYSSGTLRLRMPWPEARLDWNGTVALPDGFEFFGRLWRVFRFEQSAEGSVVDLVSTGVLAIPPRTSRRKPASVDIAWTALQNALESSMEEKSEEPVEKLRHDELIPLGRALYALAECVTHRRLRKPDAIAARVSAVSYHASAVQASHGRVPSRVLPEPVRNALLDRRLDVAVARTLREIFEGLPDMPPGPPPRFPRFLRRAA